MVTSIPDPVPAAAGSDEKHPQNEDAVISLASLSSADSLPPDEELEKALAHLPEPKRAVLRQQLYMLPQSVSYFGLYRYTTRLDLFILAVSVVCAIAGGAALPLFTVCPV